MDDVKGGGWIFFVDVLIIYGLAAYGGYASHSRAGDRAAAH
jgi:hypothetical protein